MLQRERSLILRQLTIKLGELDESIRERVSVLSLVKLELLGIALFDFSTMVYLDAWLLGLGEGG